jgi:hypothetical protein
MLFGELLVSNCCLKLCPESVMASNPKLQTLKANTTLSITKQPSNHHQNIQNTASSTQVRFLKSHESTNNKKSLSNSHLHCCNPFLGPHKYKKIYIYKKKNLNSVVLTLFLYPPRALPKSRELNLDSRAQWPTSRSMICSQGALAKERRGEFFFLKRTRERDEGGGWKTKEGESFFEQRRGERERSKGRKGPRGQGTLKGQGGEM